MTDFTPFPKIPRLNRDCTITEKIDGTNAAVVIESFDFGPNVGVTHRVTAQSRNRIITPDDDNFGFAKWVSSNSTELMRTLGFGVHFGEWWGSGIQRKYGLTGDDKRFSLFNAFRWKDADFSSVRGLGVVPVLYEGPFDSSVVAGCLDDLRHNGSKAADFASPEGLIIYHHAAKQYFKVTCENDSQPKGQV